jgi:2-polyprenyl-3-methyl-5-hydroxy-6-metoxy-1,4-benzoquinol methylase
MIFGNSMSLYDSERLKCMVKLIPQGSSASNALDLGCRTGLMAQTVRKKGYSYVGLDIARNVLFEGHRLKGRNPANFVEGDACFLPFSLNFKLVLALEVIEHLKNPRKLLGEIERVLLSDGYLLISTPNRLSAEGAMGRLQTLLTGKLWKAWNKEHRHIFSSFELMSLLRNSFSVEDVWGYYYLPNLLPEKFERKLRLYDPLRYYKTNHKMVNMFGFQFIVLLRKI